MKRQVETIDAVPSKRIFLSIMADYDLNRAICELVDNAIDEWTNQGRQTKLTISLELDTHQQSITIKDNAGGVRKDALRLLVSPGESGNSLDARTIGVFGVGTKRAVVALSQAIVIQSRFQEHQTYQVDIDDHWLSHKDWELPVYEVGEIPPSSTVISLARLRMSIDDAKVERLRGHLGATYADFIEHENVELLLNDVKVTSVLFERWSFPPGFEPQRYSAKIQLSKGKEVALEAVAGLADSSSPATGEYGVYCYCNNRLVARALRSIEVGFVKGLAGAPHPGVSLVRVILRMSGPVQCMPWNSSKSALAYEHETFHAIQPWLVQVVTDFAKLSRNWQGEWPEKVFAFSSGSVKTVARDDFCTTRKSYLPEFPTFRRHLLDRVAESNEEIFHSKPYTRGLAEGVVAADILTKKKLAERNRFALILLDSTLEIAFKDYLAHESQKHLSDGEVVKLFAQRHTVHAKVKETVEFSPNFWHKVEYYYKLRCKLVHEKATAPISEEHIRDFRHQVAHALRKLFGIEFP